MEDAIAGLMECPNLQCGRWVGIGFIPSEPFCQVLCGHCRCEVEFMNPFFVEPDPTSSEEGPGEVKGE